MVESIPESNKDKREYPRFRIEGATAVLGKPGFLASLGLGPIRHTVINLSQGGAMVRVGKRLPVESRHDLRIEIPQTKEVVETQGEIRWCAQSAKKDSDFYVGIRFVDVAPTDLSKLAGISRHFTSTTDKNNPAAQNEAVSVQLKLPPS